MIKTTVSVKRHIAKTISYRLLGTLTTVIVAYSFGADLKLASLMGFGELIFKPIIYFIHERLWYRSKYGLKQIETD